MDETPKSMKNLIVAWDVIYEALEGVCIFPTVSHGPVEVGFDAFS